MRQCPILMYHWFRPDGEPTRSRSPHLEITPQLFRRQIDFLAAEGYRTVSLAAALGADPVTPLPSQPIVITFDDGTLDFWTEARPVLQRRGFTATAFVVTGRVGEESSWDSDVGEPARPLMSWDQLRALHEEGFEIGSHTHTHRVLTSLDDDESRIELTRSRETIAEHLGSPAEVLAYPRGSYDERHKRMAADAGYRGACAVILHFRDLWRADRFELKRMTVRGTESMARFKVRLGLSRIVRLRT